MAIRICISLVAFIVCLEVSAQEKWQKFISGLERRDMSLSISGSGGVSYFQYDTKAIDNQFPTGEATLQILLSKRLNNYFWIETGVRTGIKFKKSPGYDYDSVEVPLEAWLYDLIEVDRSLSTYNHFMFGVPLTIQYQIMKFQVGIGGSYRHYSVPKNNGNPNDVFAGRNEAGLFGMLRSPIAAGFKLGVDYYYGLVNVHKLGTMISIGGPGKISYNTYSRVAQFGFYYTFGVKPR